MPRRSSPNCAQRDGDLQFALLEADTQKGAMRDYLQTETLLLEGLVRATLAPEVAASRLRQLTSILYDFVGRLYVVA